MPPTDEPRQGDHVFNDVAIAVTRPFEIIKAMRSADADGQHFVHEHLLCTYSFLRRATYTPEFRAAREFSATGGMESTLRVLAEIRERFPRAASVTGAQLRALHDRNSAEFGAAATRFEIAFLRTVSRCLETLLRSGDTPTASHAGTNPGIVYQQMFDDAYDPAAALRVVADSRLRETPNSRGVIDRWIGGVVETLTTPPLWREPYRALPAYGKTLPSTAAERIIHTIGSALLRLDSAKTRGLSLTMTMTNELLSNGRQRSADLERKFGALLSLIHQRLQQVQHQHL